MNTKTVLVGVVGLVIIIGGWLLFRDNTPPLVTLPTSEASLIKAAAALSTEQPEAGEPTTLTFSFTNPDGTPISNLMTHHARRVHVLIVGEDLSSIGHIHPEDFGSINSVTYTFPKAGRYIVGVDVMTMDSKLAQQFVVNVKGSPKMGEIAADPRLEKCFRGYQEAGHDRYVNPIFTSESEVQCPEGYKVTMTPSVKTITAGEEVRLTYRVERDGAPVMNLSPYLDAAIHFAIVPESFDALLHRHGNAVVEHAMAMEHGEETHGMEEHGETMHEEMEVESTGHHHGAVPESFGPELVSESLVFPHAGLYQVFAQVKHEGNIIFANFMVEVEESFDAASASILDLTVADRALMPHIVTLTEGDKVILRVRTDEAGEFHIAGYEIEKEMAVGEVTEVRFTANLAGRYNLELHPEGTDDDIEIGALVVNPR